LMRYVERLCSAPEALKLVGIIGRKGRLNSAFLIR
jgi:hypothetical protein